MIAKLFPLDKNYILRQAQSAMLEQGIGLMKEEIIRSYVAYFNPLQLPESTYTTIITREEVPEASLSLLYAQLSGIYRLRFGSNQLELLFDGRSHFEKFQDDWTAALRLWMRQLGQDPAFIKSCLRLSFLYEHEQQAIWAENQAKRLINTFFEVKIIKRKGELKLLKA
ncbi:hypothetical protein A3SI_07859 [Nitritalea halalkaliphila LW7]|uniref:Uncharacterized protein n=2 Tax=Nitritalea TaxID=1187887 RepID=I5C5T4_9BACT|nr:hypothetical protein A3SI_07859 [Nitritalea halalkaliphila LW7]